MPRDLFAESNINVNPRSPRDLFAENGVDHDLTSASDAYTVPVPDQIPYQRGITSDIENALMSIPGALVSGAKTAITGAPGAIYQFLSPPGSDSSNRFAKNVLSGLARVGKGVVNTPHNLTKTLANEGYISPKSVIGAAIPEDTDYSKLLGINDVSDSDRLIQGFSQYLPAAIAGGEGLLGQSAAGAAFGATQSDNPIEGTVLGATLPGAAKGSLYGLSKLGSATKTGLGSLVGTEGSKTVIANKLLDYLNNQSRKGNALSPEQAREYSQKVFTDTSGNPLPVDIGTLTNNPALSKVFNALKNVPLSGASSKANQLASQLAEKDVNSLESGVMQLQDQNFANRQVNDNIINEMAKLQKAKDANSQFISQANVGLNDLVPRDKDLLTFGSDSLKDTYNKNRDEVRNAFAPINNSELDLSKIASPNDFSQYRKNAEKLLNQSEQLKELFGSNSEMGPRLNSEIKAASKFLGIDSESSLDKEAASELARLNLPNKYHEKIKESLRRAYPKQEAGNISLSSVIDRVKNLGKLEASAKSLGQNNEARLLGNLRTSLKNDVIDLLNKSGNQDLAKQWDYANELHQQKIVPYWQDSIIRKTATNKDYTPDADKLSAALHKTNNHDVLRQQSDAAKKAYAFEILTKGNYDVDNSSSMLAEQIAKNYGSTKSHVRKAMNEYIPEAVTYLKSLPKAINQNKLIDKRIDSLSKQQSEILKQSEALKGMQKALEDARVKQLSLKKEGSSPINLGSIPKSLMSLLARTSGLGGMATGALPKSLVDLLTSEQLRKAYFEGTKIPKKNLVEIAINKFKKQGAQ